MDVAAVIERELRRDRGDQVVKFRGEPRRQSVGDRVERVGHHQGEVLIAVNENLA